MAPNSKKHIYIVIDHPMQIGEALAIALYLRKEYKISLLISRHHYWNGMKTEWMKDFFGSIVWFPKIEFSWIFPRELLYIIQNIKMINSLHIKKTDVFIILSDHTFLESLVHSRFPDTPKIAIVPEHVYKRYFLGNCYQNKQYEEKTISKIWNKTIIPLFNLKPIYYLHNRKDHQVYVLPYDSPDTKILNAYFFLSSSSVSPDSTRTNHLSFLLPYVFHKISQATNGGVKNKVYFFGDAMDKMDEYQISFTNQCLRYLEKYFPEFELIYKPHPNDRFEQKNISLGRFKLLNTRITTEFLLLQQFESFNSYFFSIASTSIKNCILMGFQNSYYFISLYKKYSPELRQYYEGQIPQSFPAATKITSFDQKPQPYHFPSQLRPAQQSLIKLKNCLQAI